MKLQKLIALNPQIIGIDFIKKEFDEKVVLGLAGNKTDLIFEDGFDEEVFPEKGRLYAEKIGAHFSLVSAKESGKEINDLINELISKYLLLYGTDLASSYSNIKLDENTNKQNNKNWLLWWKKIRKQWNYGIHRI